MRERMWLAVIVLVGIFVLVSCASYRTASLPTLHPEFAAFAEEKESVVLACKAFTRQDCKRYLDRNVIRAGYQPIQICVHNNTERYLLFTPDAVTLPCVPAEQVAEKVHTSTLGRAGAYGVGGLILWPLLIPAVVDGVGSSQANVSLDTDFGAKSADKAVIQPYSKFNRLIFVPLPYYQPGFSVNLLDQKTKERITFNVLL